MPRPGHGVVVNPTQAIIIATLDMAYGEVAGGLTVSQLAERLPDIGRPAIGTELDQLVEQRIVRRCRVDWDEDPGRWPRYTYRLAKGPANWFLKS
jgi:hypothetical protein